MDPILLADVVVTIHLIFMLFVLFALILTLIGGVLRWSWVRNFWFRSIHLFSIGFVAAEALVGYECPLTTMEYNLRKGVFHPRTCATLAANVVGNRSENILTSLTIAGCSTLPDCEHADAPYLHHLENASAIGKFSNRTLFFDVRPEYFYIMTIIYISFGLLVVATWVFVPPRLPWRRRDEKATERTAAG